MISVLVRGEAEQPKLASLSNRDRFIVWNTAGIKQKTRVVGILTYEVNPYQYVLLCRDVHCMVGS